MVVVGFQHLWPSLWVLLLVRDCEAVLLRGCEAVLVVLFYAELLLALNNRSGDVAYIEQPKWGYCCVEQPK
jgi:hypothetical protein